MEDRLGRLDAAREALALRQAETAASAAARMRRNEMGRKPLISHKTAKWLIRRRSMISEA